MENLNGTVKVISAVVVGALVGGALGILFAPEKGSITRRKLVDGSNDMAEELSKKMKDQAELLRQKANDLEEMADKKFDDLKITVKTNVEEPLKAKM